MGEDMVHCGVNGIQFFPSQLLEWLLWWYLRISSGSCVAWGTGDHAVEHDSRLLAQHTLQAWHVSLDKGQSTRIETKNHHSITPFVTEHRHRVHPIGGVDPCSMLGQH